MFRLCFTALSSLFLLPFAFFVSSVCCYFGGGPFCSLRWWSREVFEDLVVPCSVFEVLLVAVVPISSEVHIYFVFRLVFREEKQ